MKKIFLILFSIANIIVFAQGQEKTSIDWMSLEKAEKTDLMFLCFLSKEKAEKHKVRLIDFLDPDFERSQGFLLPAGSSRAYFTTQPPEYD